MTVPANIETVVSQNYSFISSSNKFKEISQEATETVSNMAKNTLKQVVKNRLKSNPTKKSHSVSNTTHFLRRIDVKKVSNSFKGLLVVTNERISTIKTEASIGQITECVSKQKLDSWRKSVKKKSAMVDRINVLNSEFLIFIQGLGDLKGKKASVKGALAFLDECFTGINHLNDQEKAKFLEFVVSYKALSQELLKNSSCSEFRDEISELLINVSSAINILCKNTTSPSPVLSTTTSCDSTEPNAKVLKEDLLKKALKDKVAAAYKICDSSLLKLLDDKFDKFQTHPDFFKIKNCRTRAGMALTGIRNALYDDDDDVAAHQKTLLDLRKEFSKLTFSYKNDPEGFNEVRDVARDMVKAFNRVNSRVKKMVEAKKD